MREKETDSTQLRSKILEQLASGKKVRDFPDFLRRRITIRDVGKGRNIAKEYGVDLKGLNQDEAAKIKQYLDGEKLKQPVGLFKGKIRPLEEPLAKGPKIDVEGFVSELCAKSRFSAGNGRKLELAAYLNPCGTVYLARDLADNYQLPGRLSPRRIYALLKKNLPKETFKQAGIKKVQLTTENFLIVERKLLGNARSYNGVEGMLRLADEMEVPVSGLFDAYSALRKMNLVEDLGWRAMD